MSFHEIMNTCQIMSLDISRSYDIPLVHLFMNDLISLVCPPWGNVFTFVPLGEVFHYMGGALGVVMITAGACGGWTSVETELHGEHLDLAYAMMNVEK